MNFTFPVLRKPVSLEALTALSIILHVTPIPNKSLREEDKLLPQIFRSSNHEDDQSSDTVLSHYRAPHARNVALGTKAIL